MDGLSSLMTLILMVLNADIGRYWYDISFINAPYLSGSVKEYDSLST